MMKVLVTGATGMVGAKLCQRLLKVDVTVRALTRRPLDHPFVTDQSIEGFRGELTNPQDLVHACQGCEEVYHVAGMISYLNRDREQLHQVNVEGTRAVLEAARQAGVRRVVLTSSTAAVGISPGRGITLDETSPFDPRWKRNPYMDSKREGEELALSFPGIEVVAVNPSSIYGAGDVKLNTGAVFRKIKQGKLNSCPPGGNAMVSVSDCVEGHLLAMRKGKPGERYILSTANLPYCEIFAIIARSVEASPPKRQLPSWLYPLAASSTWVSEKLGGKVSPHIIKIGFVERYFSAEKAQRELGWNPTQSVPEMMQEAADFYHKHGLL